MAKEQQSCRFDSLETKIVIWHKGGQGNPFYEVQRTIKGKMRVLVTTASQECANKVYRHEVNRQMDILRKTQDEEAVQRLTNESHRAYGDW